jgi:uncharacterized protein YecA (UPF0149 family)
MERMAEEIRAGRSPANVMRRGGEERGGARRAPSRGAPQPNAGCPCGSGRKYKRCCGC